MIIAQQQQKAKYPLYISSFIITIITEAKETNYKRKKT